MDQLGYALGGPADGTIDPDYVAFEAHVKAILKNFLEMKVKRIYVIIMHQGMEGGSRYQSKIQRWNFISRVS